MVKKFARQSDIKNYILQKLTWTRRGEGTIMNISTNQCLEEHTQIHEKVMNKKSQEAISLKAFFAFCKMEGSLPGG
jgi:hypothetical protein